MAAVMQVPIASPHFPTIVDDDDTSHVDITHLSGITMTEPIKETQPKFQLTRATDSTSKLTSKRSSMASVSTTKSQLRHSNQLLIGMLQNIQSELETHRTILLDVQQRVTHLEDESESSVYHDASHSALRALEGNKRGSWLPPLPPPEGLSWWQACQAFARNSEPPISATEFLRTPRPCSAIDWPLAPSPVVEKVTPPATPPHVEDLPPLTPTSDSENSNLSTPIRHDINLGQEITSPTPKLDLVDSEIKSIEVEFDKKKLPAPPLLKPAPAAKRPATSSTEGPEPAVEVEPTVSDPPLETESKIVENSMRFYKGVKSLITYKALMKHKATEKEHHVLIHFHRRSDLKHLETDE
ncbi:hypothetical protein DM02DRAFT_697500 [Periconia macrospinosa]|uniref:Uncharacterized protein n=1 Tax=Periconia macrospinosa TaxID=97972 RepID=A0A2V1D536_9PLEO|nr:hypothetical protein DM02DRAFT_697500 [Periconia macrospinosa]